MTHFQIYQILCLSLANKSDFVLCLSMKSFLVIPLFLCYIFILFGFGEAQDQEWTTAFSLEGEHVIAKNTLLTTLPSMTKEWKVTFEVNPTDYSFKSYASVLHLTIGGKGTGSGAKVRDYLYKYTNTQIHKGKYTNTNIIPRWEIGSRGFGSTRPKASSYQLPWTEKHPITSLSNPSPLLEPGPE